MIKNSILFIALLLGMSACLDDADCVTDSTSVVYIFFIDKATMASDTLAIESIVLAGADSIFYEQNELTNIALPVNLQEGVLPVTLNIEGGAVHQFELAYDVVPRLVTEDCGVDFHVENMAVQQHDFDSVAIVKDVLEQDINKNIEIYR